MCLNSLNQLLLTNIQHEMMSSWFWPKEESNFPRNTCYRRGDCMWLLLSTFDLPGLKSTAACMNILNVFGDETKWGKNVCFDMAKLCFLFLHYKCHHSTAIKAPLFWKNPQLELSTEDKEILALTPFICFYGMFLLLLYWRVMHTVSAVFRCVWSVYGRAACGERRQEMTAVPLASPLSPQESGGSRTAGGLRTVSSGEASQRWF